MDNMTDILERTTARELGRFILDGEIDPRDEVLSEEQARILLEDELELAVRHGWKNPEKRLRRLAEKNWRSGEMIGFMKGMRAGARAVLALLGEGEIRI